MSQEFLEAIDARPRYITEVKKLTLPKELRKGGRINFIWTLVTFGLLAFEWPLGLVSAGGQAAWTIRLNRSPQGVARKNFILANHAGYAGKYREALDYYRSSLDALPDLDEVYPLMGDVYFKKGQIRQGIQAYKGYLSENPGNHIQRIKLLFILMSEGLYEEFLALMESLPHDVLHDFLLSILKAFALLQLGKPDQAEKVLDDIPESELEGEGKDMPLNYLRGRAYLLKGDRDRARKHLRQVVETKDDFMDAGKLLKSS